MQNGVAGEDKLRQFAGLIHAEATRADFNWWRTF